jgi:signal transduction histidine kinase
VTEGDTVSEATAGARLAGPPSRSPWSQSSFWLLQLVVLALALVRLAVTVAFHLDPGGVVLDVSTVAIFVIPVAMAALNYGLPGGLATVGWVAVLCIPRAVRITANGQRPQLWGEILQLGVLAALAIIVGQRVSAETRFRDQADTARRARLRAELLYQDMFESNLSPILIVDAEGFVVDANGSADRVFGSAPGTTAGPTAGQVIGPGPARRLVDVVGPEAASLVLTRLVDDAPNEENDRKPKDPGSWVGRDTGGSDVGIGGTGGSGDGVGGGEGGEEDDGEDHVRPVAFETEGRLVLYRPTATLVGSTGTDRRMQVIFEDVTAETRRHDLMEAYAGQVVLGQEEERRHIAQELHDGPLQTLIHLCRQIDSVESAPRATGTSEPDDGPSLASLRTTVEETVAELRSIARGLRPSVLDDLGLVASINQILGDAIERQGFDGSFQVEGTDRRLPPTVELAVFRIAQEAVTNVERHAAAHQVALALWFGQTWLRLRIEDDGAGFDTTASQQQGGGQSLGLPGMGERARLIGARLKVRSQVGKGTVVELWVPEEALANS